VVSFTPRSLLDMKLGRYRCRPRFGGRKFLAYAGSCARIIRSSNT